MLKLGQLITLQWPLSVQMKENVTSLTLNQKLKSELGPVAHTCNLRALGGRGGRIMRSGDQDHLGPHGKILSL